MICCEWDLRVWIILWLWCCCIWWLYLVYGVEGWFLKVIFLNVVELFLFLNFLYDFRVFVCKVRWGNNEGVWLKICDLFGWLKFVFNFCCMFLILKKFFVRFVCFFLLFLFIILYFGIWFIILYNLKSFFFILMFLNFSIFWIVLF